jgi:photosystem II stability/assembly factor-like uncharacterized protein
MKSIKYFVLLLGIILTCLSNGYTQSGWVSRESGTTTDLWDVFFVNSDTGYAVGGNMATGYQGIVLRTTDGGITWTSQDIPTNRALYGVFFTNDSTGMAVGQDGMILRTTDCGETWTSLEIETPTFLMGVFFTDDSSGVVVGLRADTSRILRTTDAGKTWSPQEHPEVIGVIAYMSAVCFCDSLNGWVVGQKGAILRTRDGGITWTKQSPVTYWPFFSVFSIDTNTAWAGHLGADIYYTSNGGDTWTRQQTGIATSPWDIFFINNDTGYVVCGWCNTCGSECGSEPEPEDGSFILRTTNGGDEWTIQKHDLTILGLYGIVFTDDSTGIIVGSGGTILTTKTGGITWIEDNRYDGMNRNSSISHSYPNPFNLATNIKFQISTSNHVTLKVYAVNGQEVATLVNKVMVPGDYEVTWDATSFPGGVYFYRLKVGTLIESKKLVLIK